MQWSGLFPASSLITTTRLTTCNVEIVAAGSKLRGAISVWLFLLIHAQRGCFVGG